MEKILLVSFDFVKSDYSETTYSVASILSSINHGSENDLSAENVSIDLSKIYEESNRDEDRIVENVKREIWTEIYPRTAYFECLAIGVSTWSNDYVSYLVNEVLADYPGKIILGGYEVTATDDDVLQSTYPGVSHFVKGYAESAIKNILKGRYPKHQKIINEKLAANDMVSPYLSNVISTSNNKIHWETKRGCPYTCGFCEWGNAANKTVQNIDEKRILDEIALFKTSSVKEINILDGTYNFGSKYIEYVENVLYNTASDITMQARFELIDKDVDCKFLDVCEKFKDRIKLEFGLQTIHDLESKIIGRSNDLEIVKRIMSLLNSRGINYEISLIYGIPGQTYTSFSESVDFIINNGCDNIRAFPLRIPKNSLMEKHRVALGVNEENIDFNVDHITSSFSFDSTDYEKMQQLAKRLYLGDFESDIKNTTGSSSDSRFFLFEEDDPHVWRLKKSFDDSPLKIYETKNKKNDYGGIGKSRDGGDFIEHILRVLAGRVLDVVVDEGSKYIRRKANENSDIREFIDFLEELYMSRFWTYVSEDRYEYCCNLKVSTSGNTYIFKGNNEISWNN